MTAQHPVDDADRSRADRPGELLAWLEHYDDAPDELTIYPAVLLAADRTTTWMSAREGSFVDLEEMR